MTPPNSFGRDIAADMQALGISHSRRVSRNGRLDWLLFVTVGAIILGLLCCRASGADPQPTRAVQVYFAPGPDCRLAVIREIDAAKVSIDCHAYGFTQPAISAAMIRAVKRGVAVRVLGDVSMESGRKSQLATLVKGGVGVRIDHVGIAIAHVKTMIFDGARMAEGSFNWTPEAERETNNLFIFSEPLSAADCRAFFEKRWKLARKPKE